jgi:adenylate cyclase
MSHPTQPWHRIAITLIPLLLAFLHATGTFRLGIVDRLDEIIYDARLNATMPRTLDERIVIVDIDEKSLAELGHWPWGRNKVAALVDSLFDTYKAAALGIEVVFAEPDESSGLKQLKLLAQTDLRQQSAFVAHVAQLQSSLDYDDMLAKSLNHRPVTMGFYFTSDRDGRSSGLLPQPAIAGHAEEDKNIHFSPWSGYGASIAPLAKAAPRAGFVNSLLSGDGLLREVPLLALYKGQYYESLPLALFRAQTGNPPLSLALGTERTAGKADGVPESVQLKRPVKSQVFYVTEKVAVRVPFRGPGGAKGGSFRYVSASDVLSKQVPLQSLQGKIILLGTTAPGMADLRVTPVGEAFPGVEVHANVISGLLDDKIPEIPAFTLLYECFMLALSGLLLAFTLPKLSAPRAVLLSAAVMGGLLGLNFWLYLDFGFVLPLASALLTAFAAFALNMSYGYFVESRSKRELAQLFGSYVAPELVVEMVKNPANYSMTAANKELTVMFCDMRGFTKMSEKMEPLQLQALLNSVFSRLTNTIRANRGTIDKYMGDCVMAFWGAPVNMPNHAELAVKTSIEMIATLESINEEHRTQGLPEIGIGIGLNTGLMCVGDMGSITRRSYTVIGDAVNLGSRLEGLSKNYGVEIVVSATTRAAAPDFTWQELDKVRVKGKQQAVSIYSPIDGTQTNHAELATELASWSTMLEAYRVQDWQQCDGLMSTIQRCSPSKYLYHLYADRIAKLRALPPDPLWDGATNFDNK